MRRHHLIILLLIVATAGVFREVSHYDFVSNWDDQTHIYNNPHLNPVTPASVLYFWQHPYLGMYRPLTFTTWAAIATVARFPQPRHSPVLGTYSLDPHVFHVASLLLHILNVLLVFIILRLLVSEDWAAGAGALLFSIHPVQVESVAFISGMQNVLVGFFSLLALWQYLRYAIAQRDGSGLKQQRTAYALATFCFVLALLAKPAAVSVPLMAWALDYWALRRPARRCTMALWPWMAIALPCMWLTQPVSIQSRTSLLDRFFVAGDTLTFYGFKLLWPLHLSIDYGRTPQLVLSQPWSYLAWIAPCGVLLLLWQNRGRWPYLMAAAGVFVAVLLPVLGFVPFKFQLFSTPADRYLYLALLGPALALAWGLNHLWTAQKNPVISGKLTAGACALVFLLLAWRSTHQVRHWQNSRTLFENSVAVNPDGWYGHFSLGLILYRQGETTAAVQRFGETLRIVPNSLPVHTFMGMALLKEGQTEAAISHFQDALKMGPNFPLAHALIGSTLDRQGKGEEAIVHLRRAVETVPDSPEMHSTLAIALARQGNMAEAVREFREAWRLRDERNTRSTTNPAQDDDTDIGDITRQQRYLDEVMKDALAMNPHYAAALNGCGKFLKKQSKREEAVTFFQEARKVDPQLHTRQLQYDS
jgi:tetratricopeptide (TPR) repeat protein